MGILGIGNEVKAAGEGIASAADGLGGLFKGIRTAITGIDPDKAAEIERIVTQAEASALAIQGELNRLDAASDSLFKGGWRPMIGWICAVSLGLYYVLRILVGLTLWVKLAWTAQTLPPMPEVGIGDIIGLTGTLLGMSGLRTIDKKAALSG